MGLWRKMGEGLRAMHFTFQVWGGFSSIYFLLSPVIDQMMFFGFRMSCLLYNDVCPMPPQNPYSPLGTQFQVTYSLFAVIPIK
jgi:hypothetical protein